MHYTTLGKTGPRISRLSMGCGRLPENDDDSTRLIHAAIDAGVNYFESATFYCNNRCVEKVGLGIKGRRDEVMVQVKVGTDPDSSADGYRRAAEEQFNRMGIDRADFFMVGWFAWDRMPLVLRKGGAMEGIRKMQDEGLIRHVGFTGHDTPEGFIKVLETGVFESMTVSYNLLNRMYEKTLDRAGELGVGVIVMNPVGGGMLGAPSPTLQKLLPGGSATTAAAALRFVLSHPAVTTACSGMNSLAELKENLAAVEAAAALSPDERAQVQNILDEYHALGQQFCTGCKYCQPCPNHVDIPSNFRLFNYHKVYGLLDWARAQYAGMKSETRAAACTRCGQCEPKCPQKIRIMEQLEAVANALG